MDGYRNRMKEMGQSVPHKRYEDMLLRAVLAEHEGVRIASCENGDFDMADIRHTVSTM